MCLRLFIIKRLQMKGDVAGQARPDSRLCRHPPQDKHLFRCCAKIQIAPATVKLDPIKTLRSRLLLACPRDGCKQPQQTIEEGRQWHLLCRSPVRLRNLQLTQYTKRGGHGITRPSALEVDVCSSAEGLLTLSSGTSSMSCIFGGIAFSPRICHLAMNPSKGSMYPPSEEND